MTTACVVTGFCIIAAAGTLGLAIFFAFNDRDAATKLRDAAKNASETLARPDDNGTPIRAQGAGVDFGGIAKLAEALEKLNPSGRFLIASIVFTTAATVVTSVGSAVGS
ncbi:hypothetical protein H7K45_24955 [Mycobacterium yunnanensis]|uniref:Uncharacterized protein n=1 Tax=Mycobacterium yunnanensis TaxID=368477 RepID=A0A9X2Z6X8_9MYCO|nr:hypothetical protein [Mycobacterium yunnanensis]MCV7423809.1 hypothetical protein [Mycobacterium yunnanensis]